MDIKNYNNHAWNKQVEANNEWTQPVTTEQVDAARKGEWSIVLTHTKVCLITGLATLKAKKCFVLLLVVVSKGLS